MITNVTPTANCAADHSPWIAYMLDPLPNSAMTFSRGRANAYADCRRQSVPETAAGADIKTVAVGNRQVVVHRGAAAGRLFDDDAALRRQCSDLLHQILVTEGYAGQHGARRAPGRRRAGFWFGPRQQVADPRFQARHDR